MTIEELDKKIEELQKEKQIAILQQEIEKIKKTKIEETIIERRTIYKDYPIYPNYPIITYYNYTFTPIIQ